MRKITFDPNKVYSFVPKKIGLARVWKCEECESLVDDPKAHTEWHEKIRYNIFYSYGAS